MKKRAQTFCRRCYFQLPAEARSMLYRGVGRGYREAVIASLETLGVAEPALPGDAPEKVERPGSDR